MMYAIGKVFIFLGIFFVVLGALLTMGVNVSWFGKLPGDIFIQKKGFSFYFPITTCILLSAIFSLIMILMRRR